MPADVLRDVVVMAVFSFPVALRNYSTRSDQRLSESQARFPGRFCTDPRVREASAPVDRRPSPPQFALRFPPSRGIVHPIALVLAIRPHAETHDRNGYHHRSYREAETWSMHRLTPFNEHLDGPRPRNPSAVSDLQTQQERGDVVVASVVSVQRASRWPATWESLGCERSPDSARARPTLA